MSLYFCLLTLIPPLYVICFLRLLHDIQVHFRLDFPMEANTMNPDQTDILYLVTEVKNIAEEKAEEKAGDKRCDLREEKG